MRQQIGGSGVDILATGLCNGEEVEWMLLTPEEQWRETLRLWDVYLAM